jgi:CRP-like cAMP-binding protein
MRSSILAGRVVVKREESGRLRVTRSVTPGGQCGEVSALNGTPRVASAIAEVRTRAPRVSLLIRCAS